MFEPKFDDLMPYVNERKPVGEQLERTLYFAIGLEALDDGEKGCS